MMLEPHRCLLLMFMLDLEQELHPDMMPRVSVVMFCIKGSQMSSQTFKRNNRLAGLCKRVLAGIFSVSKHQRLCLYVLSCSSKVQDEPLNWFDVLQPELQTGTRRKYTQKLCRCEPSVCSGIESASMRTSV